MHTTATFDAVLTRRLHQAQHFTHIYQQYQNAPSAVREVACLRAQYPAILQPIGETDLIAGRRESFWIGHSPLSGAGYCCREGQIRADLAPLAADAPQRRQAQQLIEFWREHSTEAKLRQQMAANPVLSTTFPSWDIANPTLPVYPLFRMAGIFLDYEKLLSAGLPGLREFINQRLCQVTAPDQTALFQGMLSMLELVAECAAWYAADAENQAQLSGDPIRRRQLLNLSSVLVNIQTAAPQTLAEAMQLSWLYSVLAGPINFGRMDDYLGRFLVGDLDAGRLDETEALALIRSQWQLIAALSTTDNGRVIIGGRGRNNEAAADRFALLAMEASRREKRLLLPQLSLRCYTGMNPALLDKAFDVLGEGNTFPILYNDDVNVPAVMHAFEVSEAEAQQYLPFGCGEYVLNHRSFGTPNGIINLLKVLELTLTDGRCLLRGDQIGPGTGNALADFHDFEQLFQAYTRRLQPLVDALADLQQLTYEVAAGDSNFLLLSILYDDCIARAKPIFAGGIRYRGGTLETYGNISTADSLTALKQMLFERRQISASELLAALQTDFAGQDRRRQCLLAAPKFGNNDAAADDIAVRLYSTVCRMTRAQRQRTDLHSFLVVVINNVHNVIQGRACAASADGRLARQPLTNANAPAGGMDRQGPTALLMSMAKADASLAAGTVQNVKFEKALFAKHRNTLKALLDSYFRIGGGQIMLTVVDPGEMEDAMHHPEKHQNLVVRVGGFSARFVELDRDVQMDLLRRTLHAC